MLSISLSSSLSLSFCFSFLLILIQLFNKMKSSHVSVPLYLVLLGGVDQAVEVEDLGLRQVEEGFPRGHEHRELIVDVTEILLHPGREDPHDVLKRGPGETNRES